MSRGPGTVGNRQFVTGSAVALGLCLLTGCSGVTRTNRLLAGQPCVVEYRTAATTGTSRLVLLNETAAKTPRPKSKEPVSRVKDEEMRILLTDFENLGFFDRAAPGMPARPEPFIAISLESGTWVLPRSAMREKWASLVLGVQAMWNHGDKTVIAATAGKGTDLRAEAAKLEERNRKIRQKLEGARK